MAPDHEQSCSAATSVSERLDPVHELDEPGVELAPCLEDHESSELGRERGLRSGFEEIESPGPTPLVFARNSDMPEKSLPFLLYTAIVEMEPDLLHRKVIEMEEIARYF